MINLNTLSSKILLTSLCFSLAAALCACSDGGGADFGGANPTGGGGTVTPPPPPPPPPGQDPLLSGVAFAAKSKPVTGYNVVTDLTVFQNRLYLTTSKNPLGDFGANVFYTLDGQSFTTFLDDATSQGFLRLRVINSQLYIPDGDPNGLDPGFIYITSDGNTWRRSTVTGAVHTFDVATHTGDLLCANGMASSQGALCSTGDNGATPWTQAVAVNVSRLKYLVSFKGQLFAAKRAIGSTADYVRWNGDVNTTPAQIVDAVAGEANTFRWFVSSRNRLFWSYVENGGLHTAYTDDGQTWTQIAELSGQFVSAFAELGGNVYALSHTGLWGSSNHAAFSKICNTPADNPFYPVAAGGGMNTEGVASMTVYNGKLWCGSSINGKLYRVE